jgi:hypothetical protein
MTCAGVAQAYMTMDHPDYSILAARIAVSNLHKQTKKVLSPLPLASCARGCRWWLQRCGVAECGVARWFVRWKSCAGGRAGV